MESLVYLFHIFLIIYLGSFLYITYQILFYFQNKFIFIKLFFFFTFIAYILIKVKSKYNISLLYQYIIFFFLGIYLGRKSFRNYLLTINSGIKGIVDNYLYKIKYLLKILFIPPVFFYLYCYFKTYIYYLEHPHLKPKDEYYLF